MSRPTQESNPPFLNTNNSVTAIGFSSLALCVTESHIIQQQVHHCLHVLHCLCVCVAYKTKSQQFCGAVAMTTPPMLSRYFFVMEKVIPGTVPSRVEPSSAGNYVIMYYVLYSYFCKKKKTTNKSKRSKVLENIFLEYFQVIYT